MATKKRTISVRLDDAAKQRVERAAGLLKQSSGAFLGKAGDEEAHRILLAWAADRHHQGKASLSELALETGLAVEEIMLAVGGGNRQEGLDLFLSSCRAVAEATGNPKLLRLGIDAVRLIEARTGD